MKRMLKISLNLFFGSISPILAWFVLGIALGDPSLIEVFSITYPLQFVHQIIVHLFGTGANICKEKMNKPGAAYGGFILGSVITTILFGGIACNVDMYLLFMGYNASVYRILTVYSVLQLGITTVFYILLESLYFQDRETTASLCCILFNVINITTLAATAILTKNQFVVCIFTLAVQCGYVILVVCRLGRFVHPDFTILPNFRYESSIVCSDLLLFLVYLFGLKNVNNYDAKYIAAANFATLITDTQWDALVAVTVVAKIDLVKGRFQYKEHLRRSYMLTGFLLSTSVVMLLLLYRWSAVNLGLVLIFFGLELFSFLVWARYATNNVITQLNYSASKATIIKLMAGFLRFCVSLFPTPFCTAMGLLVGSFVQFVGYEITKRRADKLGVST